MAERVSELVSETAAAKAEEGEGHGRSVCPETPGLHAGCNGRYNRNQFRKEEAIQKTYLS